jgi:dihydroxy-acid dehydratase
VTGAVDSAKLDGDDGFAARAFLRSGGLTSDEVRRRPVIGICTSWSELNPCNLPLRDLSAAVKRGVRANGGLALEFPTISLSEAFVHPTTMLLRNLMAMDVEEMIAASPIDGVVLLNGCDKTVAAQMMGALSANKPALLLGSGYRPTGTWKRQTLTIDDSWRLADERRVGAINDADWSELEGCLNPGPGVCNVLGTAITLAMTAEVLGFALPGGALVPASDPERMVLAEETGRQAVEAALEGRRPSDLVTRPALHDAWRLVCAIGGSTNSIIHLQALAGRAGIQMSWQELRELSRSTPTLGRVKPSGPFDLADLHAEGGVPAIARELADLWHVDRRTADGSAWAAIIDSVPPSRPRALAPRNDPVDACGAITMLRGSLAPDGAVIKTSAASPQLLAHIGPAVVFNGVDDMQTRVDDPALAVTANSVLVLRNAGPVGGPGMPEVGALPIPDKLYRAGVTDLVRISDARMSGTAAGTIVLHVTPEAAVGGPLGLVEDGDLIELNVSDGRLDLLVDVAELERRSQTRQQTSHTALPDRGYRRLYALHVTQADHGCDFDFLSGGSPLAAKSTADDIENALEIR